MHLIPEFGMTIKEIQNDNFEMTSKIPMTISGNEPLETAQSVGIGVMNFSIAFENIKPDILIVLGDRIEPFAATISARILGIPILHISGGDVTLGSIDNIYRDIITKLSHFHFVSTEKSKRRIVQIGENEDNIYNVGSLSLDEIYEINYSKKKLRGILNIQDAAILSYCLIVYHPETVYSVKSGNIIHNLIEAAKGKFSMIVLIYPNSDYGYNEILDTIKMYKDKSNFIACFENIKRADFLTLLKYADLFIGNSSSGIVEAPCFNLPFINIGDRQKGRERAKNVVDITSSDALDINNIMSSIDYCLKEEEFHMIMKLTKNPYGEGKTADKIISIIESIDFRSIKPKI